jgi:MraZ protein
MFRGEFDHVLDEKGRTSLPKEFRSLLAGDTPPWLTAFPRCLVIFPAEDFESLEQRLTQTSTTLEPVHDLQRLIIGKATACPFDRQGRILIPPGLREWAGLDREITFTGLGRRIEIWDRARHRLQLERIRDNYSDLSRELKDFKV